MKSIYILTFVYSTTLVFSSPLPKTHAELDEAFCNGQDLTYQGAYTIYNNLWGESSASSGGQCTTIDSLDSGILGWHTKWDWTGGSDSVKSYAHAKTNITQSPLSSIASLRSQWTWTYAGTSPKANVAYDLFTSATADANPQNEIMVWLAALDDAVPIGSKVATATLAGTHWELWDGWNDWHVYTFVPSDKSVQLKSFDVELMKFVWYLTENEGLEKSQVLQSIGAGTEAFTGSDAVFTTTAYSLTMTSH